MRTLLSLVKDEQGIQHAEEALLLALIAVAAITAAQALGGGVSSVFAGATTTMCAPTVVTGC